MTITIDQVRKGDKVRVTDKPDTDNGLTTFEVAEFTVAKVEKPRLYWGDNIWHWTRVDDGATIELLERPEPDVVPGMVFKAEGYSFVVLPNDGYHCVENASTHHDTAPSVWVHDPYTLVFDPRGAEALPNPLGIRVGDRVKRVRTSDEGSGRAVYTESVEFEVNHIDGTTGHISPKYGLTYNPKDFEVAGRDVTRLPAGTIVRGRYNILYLQTADGYIALASGRVVSEPDRLSVRLREGSAEVIYLPES